MRHLSFRELAERLKSEPSLAVLPVGCFEQHGPELPLDTDNLIATEAARRLGAMFSDRFVQVFPTIAYSTTEPNRDYCGTVNLAANDFRQHLSAVVDSIMSHPFSALLILNSHGSVVASLKEVAFAAVHQQFRARIRPVRPILVASVFDFDAQIADQFGWTPGRHADWKEFLLLWSILGPDYFDEERLARLERFASQNAFPNQLPAVLGIPAQLRSTQGVQGQPLPPVARHQYGELAEQLWSWTTRALHVSVTRAFAEFGRDFAEADGSACP